MARDRIGASTRGWQRLTASLATNAADLPHLEERRDRLAELLVQIQDLTRQQAALTASKQEVTKTLQAALAVSRLPESVQDRTWSTARAPKSIRHQPWSMPIYLGRCLIDLGQCASHRSRS